MSVFQVSRISTLLGCSVRSVDELAGGERDVLDPDRAVGVAGIGEVGAERHLQIDDAQAGGASVIEDVPDRRDERGDAGGVDARTIEHAAGRREVVLHVDDDDGGLLGLDANRRRTRLDDHTAHAPDLPSSVVRQ